MDTDPFSEAVVRSSIWELRTILDDTAQYPQFIQTVHRRGYRFIVPVTVADTPLQYYCGQETSRDRDGVASGASLDSGLERECRR